MKRVLLFLLLTAVALLWACEKDEAVSTGATPNGDADSDADGDSDSDSDSDSDAEPQELVGMTCPDGPENPDTCYCIRMGVIGIFDSAANDDDKDVTAFVDWLNNDSSATITMVNNGRKPTITADFLKDFDILLFLYQADALHSGWWSYSESEATALRKWINEGGGIVSVTGFNGNALNNEVASINSIIEPATGISYNTDMILNSCPGGLPCYCWWNANPIDGFDPDHEISNMVTQIGGFTGSSINAPDGADVVASNDTGNTVVAAEIGEGRAVALADEWPLFSKLWLDADDLSHINFQIPEREEEWPSQPCYDVEKEHWKTPGNVFQIPQFWYNVIKWAAPENECFHIEHVLIVAE